MPEGQVTIGFSFRISAGELQALPREALYAVMEGIAKVLAAKSG